MTSPANPPVVLVPRGGRWGRRVQAQLGEWGACGWVLPLIRTEVDCSAELARVQHQLREGVFDWVAVTSAAAVSTLPQRVSARIAAVGPATAGALAEAGHTVDHIPTDYSARGMLCDWRPTGHILVLHSNLAAATLTDGLRRGGATVTDVVAYSTVGTEVPAEQVRHLQTGGADAALITSGSVARALAALRPPAGLPTACLGPRTAAETRAAGLHVALVARRQRIETLVADLRLWWNTQSPSAAGPTHASSGNEN